MHESILHVYPQDFPRDTPSVVGTPQALEELRRAIGEALRRGVSHTRELQDSAGEAYVVRVACRRPHRGEPPPGRFRERLGKPETEVLSDSFWDRLGTR